MQEKPKENENQRKWETYLNIEYLWGFIFGIIAIIGIYIAQFVYLFLTDPQYDGLHVPSLNDLQIILPIAAFAWISRDFFTYFFQGSLVKYIDQVAYPTEEDRKERARVLSKWIMDLAYYSFTTIATFYILKDANFFPFVLGGKGDISLIRTDKFPAVELIPNVKIMYCIQLGFHLYSFIHQILIKKGEKKYLEFVLHHAMTLLLIIYSYSTNFVHIGTMVLIVHDSSDSFLVFARGYAYLSFKNKTFSSITYITGIFMWIYTRLFVFPVYTIWPTYQQLHMIDEKYLEIFNVITYFMIAMLMILLVMHIYWTSIMVKAIFEFFIYDKKHLKADYNSLREQKKT